MSALAAADKYIFEREQKRINGFDIPKHVRYHNDIDKAIVEFGGIRQVDGHTLALLNHGAEVMVLPADEASVRRLKRLAVGDAVTMTARGVFKTKGWRR